MRPLEDIKRDHRVAMYAADRDGASWDVLDVVDLCAEVERLRASASLRRQVNNAARAEVERLTDCEHSNDSEACGECVACLRVGMNAALKSRGEVLAALTAVTSERDRIVEEVRAEAAKHPEHEHECPKRPGRWNEGACTCDARGYPHPCPKHDPCRCNMIGMRLRAIADRGGKERP